MGSGPGDPLEKLMLLDFQDERMDLLGFFLKDNTLGVSLEDPLKVLIRGINKSSSKITHVRSGSGSSFGGPISGLHRYLILYPGPKDLLEIFPDQKRAFSIYGP